MSTSPLRLSTCALACAVAVACAGKAPPLAEAAPPDDKPPPRLFILSFDRRGLITNPLELELAAAELRESPKIDTIVVLSYGWAQDGNASSSTYRKLVASLSREWPESTPDEVAVVGVGWDSSQTGFRSLFNAILPIPLIADALAWPFDAVLFPISFWSKAAQADRIGYGGLREGLDQLLESAYPPGTTQPDVLLIGHSFGTRILSGLMQDDTGLFPVSPDPFRSADLVRGAIMLQPALVGANLPQHATYPIMTTQSRHDRANGFFFPIAQLPLNAFAFTFFEAFIRGRILDPFGNAVGTVTDVVTSPLPRPSPSEPRPGLTRTQRFRLALGEIVAIPAALAFTIVVTPVGYVYTQTTSFARRPVGHVMDTLAQLPVVEIPVWALDKALGHEVHWGQRRKGFLELGALHEAVGRGSPTGFLMPGVPDVYSPEEVRQAAAQPGCGLPRCQGIFAVDASNLISHGLWGDYEIPWRDFTLGWFDPVGSHSDYRRHEIIQLMGQLAATRDREPSAPPDPVHSDPE